MKHFYIKFESFVLCELGTTNPTAFTSLQECQAYIDHHCDPSEFPEVEFVETDNVSHLFSYVKKDI